MEEEEQEKAQFLFKKVLIVNSNPLFLSLPLPLFLSKIREGLSRIASFHCSGKRRRVSKKIWTSPKNENIFKFLRSFKAFFLRQKLMLLFYPPCFEASVLQLSCNICGWWESLNRKPRQGKVAKIFWILKAEKRMMACHVLKDFVRAHFCLTSAIFGSEKSQADASKSNSIWDIRQCGHKNKRTERHGNVLPHDNSSGWSSWGLKKLEWESN